MIETTYNSKSVFLISFRPDGSSFINASFEKKTQRDTGLSNRESRKPLADKLVCELSYRSGLSSEEAITLRAASANWANQPILCPFWPAETRIDDYASASVQGTLRVWYEPDWSNWSINTGTSPETFTPTQDCRTAPLLWGRFKEFPRSRIISGYYEEVKISLIETGDAAYALKPKSVSLVNGTSVNGLTVPLMNVPYEWGNNTSMTDVRINRSTVGFGRQDADTFYPQTPRIKNKLFFAALDGDEVAYLLKLFEDRGGSIKPFWCGAPHSLESADLIYGRFFGDRLTIRWKLAGGGTEVAFSEFEFLSLPTESTVPAGETFGTDLGPVAGPWFGYKVVLGGQTWYYTSYESDVVGPGSNTFTHRKISHGEITEEINLAVNDCTLIVHAWTNCPFTTLLQQNNADKLMVTIYEGTIDSPSAAAAIYTGEAMAPKATGPKLNIKLRGPGAILSIKGPRSVLQETCLAVLGDSRCKKSLASFSTTQNLIGLVSGVGEFDVAGATWSDGYFDGGYAERDLGTHTQRIPIKRSYEKTPGGNLAILFGSVIAPAPTATETDWVLVAGCNGRFSTCRDKFSNTENFRGAENRPTTNPGITPLQSSATSGGKK